MTAIENLAAVLAVYADTADDRRIITATSSANAATGKTTWTGLTLGDLREFLAEVKKLKRACVTLGGTLEVEILTMQAASIDERLNPGSGMAWIDNSLLDAWTYPGKDNPDALWDGQQSAVNWFDARSAEIIAHRKAVEAELEEGQ